jgi:pilus assembly protein FimV
MAFNKSKALENALKCLNQGKVAQAIAEYQQILRHDPKDQATLMTVGDLFARQGDMPQAVEYFERLAQVYLSDGFNSKAIAIYKKIAKLAPNELAPLERLADLYVQQGVLSEARPLFLQIAEAHLKANQAQRAVEVLHRLLEVEPENLRVQMRLAELYNVMGQKKEAANTYMAYAQRLFEHSELDESLKLIERAVEVDPGNSPALLLKAKVLGAGNKTDQAIAILERHPDVNGGGEVTNLLVDFELKAGRTDKAADLARKQLARGSAHFALLYRVAENLIEGGQAAEALPLLTELRPTMIEASEQDKFLQSLSRAVEHLPGRIEPLEMLADFCRHTSDPFRLSDALSRLSDAYAAKGDFPRAEKLLQELVDRNKDDERLVQRLKDLKAGRAGGGAAAATPPAAAEVVAPVVQAPAAVPEAVAQIFEAEPEPAAQPESSGAEPAIVEEVLDEETQKYLAQALTDVDLFSSYGLTQKATHLLENVLQRAPRHTPTLERLLDMHLGAGNERRTAELASLLEQIHRERNDTLNADRFAELRKRFQKVAGLTEADLPQAPPAAAPAAAAPPAPQAAIESAVMEPAPAEAAPVHSAAPAGGAGPAEFEIPLAQPEPEAAPTPAHQAAEPAEFAVPQAAAPADEVDLSDEWEKMSGAVSEAGEAPAQEAPAEEVPQAEVEAAAQASAEQPAEEPRELAIEEPAAEPAALGIAQESEFELDEPVPVRNIPEELVAPYEEQPVPPEPLLAEAEAALQAEAGQQAPEEAIEIVEEEAPAQGAPAQSADFELELTPEPAAKGSGKETTTDDLINALVAEIDGIDEPASQPALASAAAPREKAKPVHQPAPEPAAAVVAASTPTNGSSPQPTVESLNQLAEVFQEFRSELGEMGEEEDEDLETHYNLGIAYREMALLDEAIGEFQKVAKAIQKGKPFQYAMNCSTLLALSFMDKGEPKIASLWYKKALETPGLEQEAVLALRYDLGVALETAGDSNAALDSFRQVYAMNIDYRDVADRIATLQKA